MTTTTRIQVTRLEADPTAVPKLYYMNETFTQKFDVCNYLKF